MREGFIRVMDGTGAEMWQRLSGEGDCRGTSGATGTRHEQTVALEQ